MRRHVPASASRAIVSTTSTGARSGASPYLNWVRHVSPHVRGCAEWIEFHARARTLASGALDLKTKEGAGGAPSGFFPWFEAPGRRSAGVPIAFGHWSTLGLVNRPELLALDTGCVWGGSLTAVRVDGGRREVFQVECEQAQAPG